MSMKQNVPMGARVSNAIFYGVFFDEDYLMDLLEKHGISVPAGDVTLQGGPHITVCFRPSPEQEAVLRTHVGEELEVSVIGYGQDEYLTAVSVVLPKGLPYFGAEPVHMTLSVVSPGKPMNSRFLEFVPFEKPFSAVGTFGYAAKGDSREVYRKS